MCKDNGLYILMASGFSRRFGEAKLLQKLPSQQTVIAASISTLESSGCDFIVAVRRDDITLIEHVRKLNAKTVTLDNAHQGLSSAIAESVQKLHLNHLSWLGIALGDMPYIASSTFATLSESVLRDKIIRPQRSGSVGHPVLFGSDFFSGLSQLSGDDGAKAILNQYSDALIGVEVTDPMISYDIDVPEDII